MKDHSSETLASVNSWYVIDSGPGPGSYNMATDLMLAQRQDTPYPILRLYAWRPHAVSLGFHQALDDVDLDQCSKKGIDVVRRPTGGRAILHAEELTYSVVVPGASSGSITTSMQVYKRIGNALVAGLNRLGAGVELTRVDRAKYNERTYQNEFACFAASARYEIQHNGRKVVGSAQRRFENALLQHGSIMLGDEHLMLLDLLRLDQNTLNREREKLRAGTVALSKLLQRSVSYEEVAIAVTAGFREVFNVEFQQLSINPTDTARIKTIMAEPLRFRRISR